MSGKPRRLKRAWLWCKRYWRELFGAIGTLILAALGLSVWYRRRPKPKPPRAVHPSTPPIRRAIEALSQRELEARLEEIRREPIPHVTDTLGEYVRDRTGGKKPAP